MKKQRRFMGLCAAVVLTALALAACKESKPTYSKVEIAEQICDESESSYQIKAVLPKTELSRLGQPFAEKIAREWEIYDGMTEMERMVSSRLYGVVSMQMDRWEECEQAVGFAVENPLEGISWLEKTGYFGMESKDPDMPIKHIQAYVNTCNPDRIPSQINILSGYTAQDLSITLTQTIWAQDEVLTSGNAFNGYATFEQQSGKTGSGIPVLIVTAFRLNNNQYYNDDFFDPQAYWVKDNVFYRLRVMGTQDNQEQVQDVLMRILNEI